MVLRWYLLKLVSSHINVALHQRCYIKYKILEIAKSSTFFNGFGLKLKQDIHLKRYVFNR